MQIVLDDAQKKAYLEALEVFRAERQAYRLEIQRLDILIGSIEAKLGVPLPKEVLGQMLLAGVDRERKESPFLHLSIRQAIKKLFEITGAGPMETGDIASRLKAGGIRTDAEKFNASVSATLSVMASKYKEMERLEDGRWDPIFLRVDEREPLAADEDDEPFDDDQGEFIPPEEQF